MNALCQGARVILTAARGTPVMKDKMTSEADTPVRPVREDRVFPGTQNAAGVTVNTRWRKVFCAFYFLVPISSVLASQSIVPLLLLASVLLAVTIWRSPGENRWPLPNRSLAIVLAGLVAYCALASLWGFDLARSLLLAARIAALLAAGLFLHGAQQHLDQAARAQAGTWFLAGMGLALALLYLEPVLGFPVLSLLHEPATMAKAGANQLNRGATAVAILCWPACALLWRRTGAVTALCLPAAVLAALAFLNSQAAGFGLLSGAAMLVLAGAHRRAGRIVLIAATLSAMIVSPIAGNQFYEHQLQNAEWLPMSAAHRVEIWHFTVQRIAEKPVLGWGFDSARGMTHVPVQAESSGRNPIALHPHNAPLQILLELGVLGALIVLAMAWILIQRLETLPRRERILGQATYIAALAVSTTAYGLWQNQWMTLLISAALAVSLLAPAADKDQTHQ